jgi:hypothetical protein
MRVNFRSTLTTVGASAFEGCSTLQEVVFGNSMAAVGDRAFAECVGLTKLVLETLLPVIGNGAWEGCANLEGELILEPNPRSIGARERKKGGRVHMPRFDGADVPSLSHIVQCIVGVLLAWASRSLRVADDARRV